MPQSYSRQAIYRNIACLNVGFIFVSFDLACLLGKLATLLMSLSDCGFALTRLTGLLAHE